MNDPSVVQQLWDNYYRNRTNFFNAVCPFYQTGNHALLSPINRDGFYRFVCKIVRRIELGHFKRDQAYGTDKLEDSKNYRLERVLAFYDWVMCFTWPEYNPQGVIVQYERYFSKIEAYLQFKRLGISLEDMTDNETRNDIRHIIHRWPVELFIDMSVAARSGMDLYDNYLVRYQTIPSNRTFDKYMARMQVLIKALQECGGTTHYKVVGGIRGASLSLPYFGDKV